jgi:hypothetical protein
VTQQGTVELSVLHLWHRGRLYQICNDCTALLSTLYRM